MISSTCNFAFMQKSIHGGTLIARFNSPTKECTFYGDCSIPIVYDKSSIDTLIPTMFDDVRN